MFDKDNDIEYLLKQDSREKKRTGSGVFSRASRRGYTGAVRTPVDYLKGKAKKEYMKEGKMMEYNMYDDVKNIPSVKEILAMDFEAAKKIVAIAREKHTVVDLRNHWKISSKNMYSDIFDKYGIPRTNRGGNMWSKSKDKVVTEAPIVAAATITVPSDLEEVFEVKYIKKEAEGKTIQDRLSDYLSILEAEGRYEIKFIVREIR